MKKNKILAPSILSADFSNLSAQIKELEAGGADWIHCDVMDGNFVPNISFGAPVIKSIKNITKLTLDAHLMVSNPDSYIEDFIKAGCGYITVHQEAVIHLHRIIEKIKQMGAKAGVSINPSTPVASLLPILEYADMILVMSVNPGYGGQKFISSALKKIDELKKIREKGNYNFLIEVDGGLNEDNITSVIDAGCDAFVIGSSIFNGNIAERTGFFKTKLK